jgi:hypothetical protein
MDKREPARRSLEAYFKKQAKVKEQKPRRNQKPEKQVERACMEWMRNKGWSMQVIECKNTYNPFRKKWVSSATRSGTADSVGNTDQGLSAYVEFKAPGKLKTFNRPKNIRQREFIHEKINTFCFAVVVDSAERLAMIYEEYSKALKTSKIEAQKVLMAWLP